MRTYIKLQLITDKPEVDPCTCIEVQNDQVLHSVESLHEMVKANLKYSVELVKVVINIPDDYTLDDIQEIWKQLHTDSINQPTDPMMFNKELLFGLTNKLKAEILDGDLCKSDATLEYISNRLTCYYIEHKYMRFSWRVLRFIKEMRDGNVTPSLLAEVQLYFRRFNKSYVQELLQSCNLKINLDTFTVSKLSDNIIIPTLQGIRELMYKYKEDFI